MAPSFTTPELNVSAPVVARSPRVKKARRPTEAKRNRRDQRSEERRAYWAQKRPNWTSQPVARVEGALKYVMENTRDVHQNAKGDWVVKNSPVFYEALEAARNGDGNKVNALALRVLAHGK
jgi:hypothetical protein